jgi:signal transduction histidine kinase
VFFIPAVLLYVYFFQPSKQESVKVFQEKFLKKTHVLEQEINAFSTEIPLSSNGNEAWNSKKLDFRYTQPIFVYHNDSLIFWTDNSMPVPQKLNTSLANIPIIQLKNGWYYQYRIIIKNYTIIGLMLIQNAFPYENESLKNTFNADFNLRFDATISRDKKSDLIIHNSSGEYLFSLNPKDDFNAGRTTQLTVFSLFLIGLCAFSYSLFVLLLRWWNRPKIILVLATFFLTIFPWLGFHFSWFSLFSSFELFQPQLYASVVLLPTLGSLFISIALLATYSLLLISHFSFPLKSDNNSLFLKISQYSSPIIYFSIAFIIGECIKSIVEDSSIPLYIHDLLKLSAYSYFVLFFLCVLFVAFFTFSFILIKTAFSANNYKKKLLFWIIYSVFYLIFTLVLMKSIWVIGVFPVVLTGIILRVQEKKKGMFSFGISLLIIALFVCFTGIIIYHYLGQKEQKAREVYAKKLISEQDPSTEIEYVQISNQLAHSSYLENIILNNQNYNVAGLKNELEKCYFNHYWERYEIDFFLYNKDSVALVNFAASSEGNFDYFTHIISNYCETSEIAPSVYFVKNYVDKMSYLIRQPIYSKDSICGYLICALKSKKIPKEIGFPRLLLNNQAKVFLQLEDYSMAKYIDGNLVFRYGECNYPLNDFAFYKEIGKNKGIVNYRNYSHYLLSDDANRVIVLSKLQLTYSNYLTTFSFLFAFFGLCLAGFLIIFKPNSIHLKQINLAFKIQLILIALVFFTLLLFSWGAGSFVSSQYNNYTSGLIREKINSVNKDLQQKSGFEQELRAAKSSNYLDYTLQHFSTIFVTDINIYTLKGDLLSSSRPAIYNTGLISRNMNPWALRMLKYRNKSEIIHEEKIGDLGYLSAYIPIVNKKNTVLGYLNLQYFAHQNQFEEELASFLTAIITVFVFLLAITVIITIFVTNWITAPLKLIQNSVASFTLGGVYKPINYSRKDEIGSLVAEYNKKLKELEEKALELAKSERESAWREMAKQVAHEIKNPLTPMKLSIQHLQRSFDPNDPSSAEKLNRISNSIIEQIDALTKIANEFSTFAKLPTPNETRLDLIPLLSNVVAVFIHKESHYTISIEQDVENCFVIADKDLMIRVFNNLIKNAIQSIPENREGKIEISIIEIEDKYRITIKDNGSGIPDEMISKMFVPNFTTKSTGTGLGLAMVKQIMETHHGSIKFETEIDKGTIFYLELNKAEK